MRRGLSCGILRCVRTTLNIEDHILQAAKEIAQRQGSTTGRVLSQLARIGLRVANSEEPGVIRGGVPLVPSRGEVVTLERVRQLIEREGA